MNIYYFTFDRDTGELISLSTSKPEGNDFVSVGEDLALPFLFGQELLGKWKAVNLGGSWLIQKKPKISLQFAEEYRPKQLVNLISSGENADLLGVRLKLHSDHVEVFYDGSKIERWGTVSFYFTEHGNPHRLVSKLSISEDILSEAAYQQQLDEWPNPISIPLENADQLSVYFVKPKQFAKDFHSKTDLTVTLL